MKKKRILAMSLILLFTLFGCTGNKTGISDQFNGASLSEKVTVVSEEEELPVITVLGEYNELAWTLSQLVEKSELIVKIRVDSIRTFINEQACIETEITPVILETYKGNYDGEIFYVDSGEVTYEEWICNEYVKKRTEGHEAPPEEVQKNLGTIVEHSFDGEYIVHPGEEYIFFAYKREASGPYYPQYFYQGLYKVQNGKVENLALPEGPLMKDYSKLFGADKLKFLSKCSRYKLSVDEESFVKQIKS